MLMFDASHSFMYLPKNARYFTMFNIPLTAMRDRKCSQSMKTVHATQTEAALSSLDMDFSNTDPSKMLCLLLTRMF